ncbi:AAA family ATPase [Allokutzneria albata]|uniref:Predicted kinase n=1 Tax=Allokutzneria albata TaxID=211114 RepID=A0A1G9V7R2_ALLAB|nr:AAA family ATPase [Allokutzneria albata]SDM68248.1 Predicted kinase [Allokutzneria albata]
MTEVAILIGLQASGKTSFYRAVLAATHEHVSKDAFPNARRRQARQLRLIGEALDAGRDVVVDNTNPSSEEWQPIMTVARARGARVVGYWFPPDPVASLERNALRDTKTRVPDVGLYATLKRLRRPRAEDGFDELLTVRFDGRGGFHVESFEERRCTGVSSKPGNARGSGSTS